MKNNAGSPAERWVPNLLLALCLLLLFTPLEDKPPLTGPQLAPEPSPPGPPLLETFQGAPQLSLFPRLGDFRPEDDNDRLPFWNTYREHLLKISGVVKTDPVSANRAFSFRGIKGINSVGHFSPLAVKPNRRYKIGLKLKVDLPDGSSTGVGIIEYRQFLWLGEQYPESLHRQFFLANQELLRIGRTAGWQDFQLTFTSGPQTRMIHLLFFREGPASDRRPVLIDNVSLLAE